MLFKKRSESGYGIVSVEKIFDVHAVYGNQYFKQMFNMIIYIGVHAK